MTADVRDRYEAETARLREELDSLRPRSDRTRLRRNSDSQRDSHDRRDNVTCWTYGNVGHYRRDCERVAEMRRQEEQKNYLQSGTY